MNLTGFRPGNGHALEEGNPLNPTEPAMNATPTVQMFTASRRSHSLGLVVAGAIFALVGLGGSGAIVQNFVTAGSVAVAPAPAAHIG